MISGRYQFLFFRESILGLTATVSFLLFIESIFGLFFFFHPSFGPAVLRRSFALDLDVSLVDCLSDCAFNKPDNSRQASNKMNDLFIMNYC